MREVLDQHPDVVEYAREAIRAPASTVRERPIRGGTDGSRLSFMGLPTPNIFAGRAELSFAARVGVGAGHGEGRRGDRRAGAGVGGANIASSVVRYPLSVIARTPDNACTMTADRG